MPEAARPVDMGAAEVLAQAGVSAAASLSLSLADAEALRSNAGPGAGGLPQLAKTLRNADEQSITSVAAMLRAIAEIGTPVTSYRDWVILGCPRFLGRMPITHAIVRFAEDPKYSVSPHLVPSFSLHSLSGTVSVGLGVNGPNFGVGGGPDNVPEGFLTALSLVAEGRHPGVWLLLSEFDPEPLPDKTGKPTNAVNVHAVALALTSGDDGIGCVRLRRASSPKAAPVTVRDVGRFVSDRAGTFQVSIEGLGLVELDLERSR